MVVEHYIRKRGLGEIADEMGLSHAAIRVRMHRIRLKLKKIFSTL